MKVASTLAALFTLHLASASAALLITEVNPSGSGNGTYAADWFELTNTGGASLDITGWKMDDSSATFSSAVALSGITSIASGESVIFLETSTLASTQTSFVNAWFGGTAPAGLQFGNYSGSGVGLGTSGDAVNIFNSTGTLMASVSFGTATSGKTFDNAAGLNNATISTLSTVGVNGAFTSSDGAEIGSPGTITAVPEPSTYALATAGLLGMLLWARTRRRALV
jgi:hypothetical protein